MSAWDDLTPEQQIDVGFLLDVTRSMSIDEVIERCEEALRILRGETDCHKERNV